jgi:RNA-directed DNA polymerase
MRYLERRLGIPREKLRRIATESDFHYAPRTDEKPPRPFAKKKVKPKVRDLDCPRDPLKDVQRRIQHHLLRDLEMPDYICGGVKGHSVLDNVAHHQNASLIVTVDIKSWFPSITAENVYFVWYTVLKCSDEVATLLTALTTFNGHLPQGAPTSTTLSNLVLYSIDLPIRHAAAALGVRYSSWVDDLTLSGLHARKLIPIVASTLRGARFKVARSKLKVMGGSKQRVVNGVVAGVEPSIPKQTRDRIRAALHRLRSGDIYEEDKESYTATQKGRIVYFKSVNAQQTRSLEFELMRLLEKTEG